MNLGTIGTNWITSKFIKAAKETGLLTLSAVYSRTEKKANEFASTHGVENTFTNLEEMAKSNSIDCIYIASPNSLHFEQALMFLKNHKHVICEKPIFSKTVELEKAYQIAADNNVYLFEALRNIHVPNFTSLKENLDHIGKIRGSILHRVRYSSRYTDYLNGENPNVFSPEFSGGALVDLGIYPLSLAVALFGKPETSTYFPVLLDSGVDGGGTLILNYTDFTCTVICSKITTSYLASEIHGEKGTITIDDPGRLTNLQLTNIHDGSTTAINEDQDDKDMIYEIQSFVNIIKTNDQQRYEELKQLSKDVLSITESARKQ
ncbi:Gfo/Idh/MocA family protein [Virgibacillus byunsanensis]|uniref:Gfo/Idh/MocA family protein n=1 Tax=Virgibacillus byunsanensis TaxID=570945 RepID=A0ABW3LKU4_9BACI